MDVCGHAHGRISHISRTSLQPFVQSRESLVVQTLAQRSNQDHAQLAVFGRGWCGQNNNHIASDIRGHAKCDTRVL
jgi:hypothetical protein